MHNNAAANNCVRRAWSTQHNFMFMGAPRAPECQRAVCPCRRIKLKQARARTVKLPCGGGGGGDGGGDGGIEVRDAQRALSRLITCHARR